MTWGEIRDGLNSLADVVAGIRADTAVQVKALNMRIDDLYQQMEPWGSSSSFSCKLDGMKGQVDGIKRQVEQLVGWVHAHAATHEKETHGDDGEKAADGA